MSLIKRLFVFSLVITTVLWSMGGLTVKAAGSYGAGSLLALEGVSGAAVYYIGSDGMKYVFPDGKTYNTWYDNFDNVVRVNVAELDLYADGGAVTYRPGTKLVTHMNTAKIYAVGPGGTLHWIPTGDVAEDLYGADWGSRVLDVIPGYFSSSYTTGSDLSTMYPEGTLLQVGEDLYYVGEGDTVRPFATSDAFEANNFSYDYVIDVANVDGYSTGESITGEETELAGYMPGEGGGPVSGGDLTVSLASDTPASGIVVEGAARYPFTKLKLTTGSEGVTIDTMVVQRGGIGQDAAFSTIDVLDGSTMIPFDQNSKTFNSNHQATFTKDVVIPANTTQYIYLAGNMAASLDSYAGENPALGLASITLKGSGSVIGSLPAYGNTQTLNHTITIGTATVQRGSYNNASSTTIEVGKQDYTFFAFQIQAGSVEDVTFNQVSVYQEGTASLSEDLSGYALLKDGTKIADGVVDGKYINFSIAATTIPKGQTYQYQVQADVESGSARTVDLGIYRTTDLLVKGNTYGYNITPTYSGTGSAATKPVLSANEFQIANGNMTVERGSSVGADNVTVGSDQTLGAFKFTVKGEPIDVTELTLTIVSSSGAQIEDALEGVKIVDSNGVTVAGPTDITNDALTVAFTDTFTLPVGESEYTIMGNLNISGGWATDDTIYARLATAASAITATGQVTGNSITASPAANVDTNTQTVKAANLTVTRNTLPANATVIAGAQDVLVGSWNFDGTNSGEDIRITSIVVHASSTNFTNLTIYDGVFGSGGVAKSPVNDAPADNDGYDSASSTFAFDDPIVLTKGTSKTIQLIADVNTGAVAEQVGIFGLVDVSTTANASVIAYGVTSGNRGIVTLTADMGATMTVATAGTLTISTYNNPSAAIVRAGATGVTFGNIRLEAFNENLDLDQLKVFVADGNITGTATGNYQDVSKVYLYDGSTLLGSAAIPSTGYYTFNFPNNTLTIPQDGSKTITVKADLGTISSSADNAPGTPGADVRFGLGGTDGVKTTGVDSNDVVTSETYNGSTTTGMVLHKALPTVTHSTASAPLGAATSLTNGAIDLYAFNVAADASGNEVLLYRATLTVATGGTINVTSCYLRDSDGNVVGTAADPTDLDGGDGYGGYNTYTFDNPLISHSDELEPLQISAGSSETYYYNCTIALAGTGENVSVAMLGDTASSTSSDGYGNPTTDINTNYADAWGALNQGNFVWSDNYKGRGIDTTGATATEYGQWYNGYLVSGLGAVTTSTPSYTISWSG